MRGEDLRRGLSDHLCRGAAEQLLRRIVEHHDPLIRVDGHKADGHVLDEAVGEGLHSREGGPGGPVSQGKEEGHDAGDADEKKHRGSDDRVTRVLFMGRLDGRHIEAHEDHVGGPAMPSPLNPP